MNTTDGQIKVVEDFRESYIREHEGWLPEHRVGIDENIAAFTAILSELREMRELLEAAAQIVIVNGDLPDGGTKAHSLFNVGTGWIIDSNRDNDKEYDFALDAYREVKKQI